MVKFVTDSPNSTRSDARRLLETFEAIVFGIRNEHMRYLCKQRVVRIIGIVLMPPGNGKGRDLSQVVPIFIAVAKSKSK